MFTRLPCALFLCAALAACGGGGGGGSSDAPTNAPEQTTASGNSPSPSTGEEPSQVAPEETEIKLLALYTDGVADQFVDPDLRIQHLVSVANDVLAQSGVALTFTAEHVEWVDHPDQRPITQALDDITFGADPSVAHIAELRDQVAADLVVLFRPYANDGHCGYAWLGGYQTAGDFSNPAEADYGYSVVAANCSDYTLLHELGHNLGLAHSRREDPDGGTFDYALGYGLDNDFATIMASPDEFAAPQLPRLSSPDLECNGMPCGIPHTDTANGSDAVRALAVSKDQVAAYR